MDSSHCEIELESFAMSLKSLVLCLGRCVHGQQRHADAHELYGIQWWGSDELPLLCLQLPTVHVCGYIRLYAFASPKSTLQPKLAPQSLVQITMLT